MRRAFHPWLLCVYPIVYLYAQNLGIVHDGEVPVALLISLVATTAVYALLRIACGSAHKAALATSVLVVVFFTGGHAAAVAREADAGQLSHHLLSILFYAGAVALAVVFWFVPDEQATALHLSCNAVALFLLAAPTYAIVRHGFQVMAREDGEVIAVGEKPARVPKVRDGPEHPDVYFIVADGYSSNRKLLRENGYDNSAFTDRLEALGFTVLYDSKSSYGATMHSLASTLNLRYVPENTATTDVNDVSFLHVLIADSLVARILIERGYTYLHFLSGVLLPSSIADTNYSFSPNGIAEYRYDELQPDLHNLDKQAITDGRFLKRSFLPFLVETTLLYPYGAEIREALADPSRPYRWQDPQRFLDTLAALEAVADRPEATFAFVHLLEPHGPVQVDRVGRAIARETWDPTPEQFFDELAFVNDRLFLTLATLIDRSAHPPIIVLQADHGTTLGRVWTDDRTLTNFEILNAVYTPDPSRAALAADATPANTWVAILNAWFDAGLEPLEPRYFDLPEGYEAPFDQVEVTDRFR